MSALGSCVMNFHTEMLQFSSIGGELGSERTRLKELEKDMKDFKDIQKRYMNQLIKVKVSLLDAGGDRSDIHINEDV
jgi:hypothetical protein